MPSDELSIGEFSARSGVPPSTLRFYESKGLLHSHRSAGGQRRYDREELRRVSFVLAAQQVGLSLEEIRDAMASLPDNRVPTKADWALLSRSWRPRLDHQIAVLERLRDRLTGCIGCGCLSLTACKLHNPNDVAGQTGSGPCYVFQDAPRR